MIKLLDSKYNQMLMKFLKKDSIINYFILQGLEREKYKKTFEKKWGEFDNNGNLKSVLLKRQTGNMQFYSGSDYDVDGFIGILKNEGFKMLIGEKEILKRFLYKFNFSEVQEGAFISKLDKNKYSLDIENDENIQKINIDDINKIVDLYKETFSGFTPKEMMLAKYKDNTGRGYYIDKDGKIISIAQSVYEQKDSAIIVGVATKPIHRKKGLATKCLIKLCKELLVEEGKILYLQYDNPKAGELYKRLGFKDIGRMINCFGGVHNV